MDRYVETAGLIIEVDTEDPTYSGHSNKKIWYVPPAADGTAGLIANKQSVNAVAVSGLAGNSVAQGTVIILTPGILKFWSESTNAGGVPCVSPPSFIAVEHLGTIRR